MFLKGSMSLFSGYKKRSEQEKNPLSSIDDFFNDGSQDFTIDSVDDRKMGFLSKSRGFFAFVVTSLVAGFLVALLPLTTLGGLAVISSPFIEDWKNLPEDLGDVSISQRNIMYDANGNVFAEVYTEDRVAVSSLDNISKYAQQGLVDTEDNRFYQHGGFDLKGTVRSALTGSGGGSTITQQLVKNLLFYSSAGKEKKAQAVEHSVGRKVRELKYAINYEKTHSKDDILLSYFNTVSFGSPNIYSIESASQYFFGKSAKDLDLAEASVLVGTVQNPTIYNLNNPDAEKSWKNRQHDVLGRMVAEGHITQDEADKAYKEKLNFVKKKQSGGTCESSKYPFYCEYVLNYLKNSSRLGENAEERSAILAKGGLRINTYMEPQTMDIIDKKLESDFGNDNRAVAPTAVVKPGTGGVAGIGVNRNYGVGSGETTINVANNPAATGSTYKMITLATALENGFDESSLQFGSQCPLAPAGYDYPDGGFKNSVAPGCGFQAGNLNYKQATAWSSNTWFVTLAMKIGINKITDMSRQLNLSVPDTINDRSLSYVLGPTENSPINMASAYATFANEGIFCPATPVKDYKYADGTSPVIPDNYDPNTDACRRVMSPHTASVVLKAMRANTYGEVPDAFGVKARIPGYDAVGKSGTNETYNLTWGQVSKQYSLFTDVYDMDQVTRGVYGNSYFKGRMILENSAEEEGSEILGQVLQGKKNIPLDFNSQDKTKKPVPVEMRDYFTVPSVIGMTPSQALDTMRSVGITANVSNDKKKAPENYQSGVIVEQTLEPGRQLPVGTKKEIILYESK